jgi:hypothetical protein
MIPFNLSMILTEIFNALQMENVREWGFGGHVGLPPLRQIDDVAELEGMTRLL